MEKILKLDDETLKKGWGAEGQYWFSYNSYTVKDVVSCVENDIPDDVSDSEYLLSLGYIPFFRVSRLELSRAYINAVGSKKLQDKLNAINDEDYIEAFWKYFNAYKHLSDGYEEFQNNFLIKKAIDWCNDNDIKFEVM